LSHVHVQYRKTKLSQIYPYNLYLSTYWKEKRSSAAMEGQTHLTLGRTEEKK